jgi:hypothetical protein
VDLLSQESRISYTALLITYILILCYFTIKENDCEFCCVLGLAQCNQAAVCQRTERSFCHQHHHHHQQQQIKISDCVDSRFLWNVGKFVPTTRRYTNKKTTVLYTLLTVVVCINNFFPSLDTILSFGTLLKTILTAEASWSSVTLVPIYFIFLGQ